MSEGSSVSPSRESPRWSVSPHLIWTQYDDSSDWVVYDPASADLHLLTDSAHLLWTLIESDAPRSIDALIEALARELERPVDEDLRSATTDVMAFMDTAGLIRQAR